MRAFPAIAALALLAAPDRTAGEGPGQLVYEKTLDGNTDLYVVATGGGAERRLTDDPAEDALPRFSPDGARVLFSSKRNGEWQLYEVAAGGGPARKLWTGLPREWQADPSPDGRWLAYVGGRGKAEELLLRPRAGGAARVLVSHGERVVLGNPSWSRDGARIAFSSNRGFAGHAAYVVDVTTGEERRVSPLTSGACEPRFSRDGKRVAYVRRRHATRQRSQIVEHDLESGAERVLVDWPALNYDPAYSPDGGELAFASTIAGEFAVYRLRLSDGKSWRVTHGPGSARHPDFRPAR